MDNFAGTMFGLAFLFVMIAFVLRAKRKRINTPGELYWTGFQPPVDYENRVKGGYESVAPSGATVTTLSNHGRVLFDRTNKKIADSQEIIAAHQQLIEKLSVDRSKISSGLNGENAVAEFLKQQVNEKWVIIEGFMGGKGEIDFVLIGPAGVFAFEVKNRNGVISCNGDEWNLTKPDGTIENLKDNGGRSPARQINETAGWMENELRRAGYSLSVPKAVIWAHPKAGLGSIVNMTIQYLILLGPHAAMNLKSFFELGTRLSSEQILAVARDVNSIHQQQQRGKKC